jgi:hypothetical protein
MIGPLNVFSRIQNIAYFQTLYYTKRFSGKIYIKESY